MKPYLPLNELENNIREIVRDEVNKTLSENGKLEFHGMTVSEAAKAIPCSPSVVLDLIHERDVTGFPGVQVSSRTFSIDRDRFFVWMKNGGLLAKTEK